MSRDACYVVDDEEEKELPRIDHSATSIVKVDNGDVLKGKSLENFSRLVLKGRMRNG